MTLLPQFAWLAQEPGPKMLSEVLKLYGVHEGLGAADNPEILAWVKEIADVSPAKKRGVADYRHDSIAWCGLFMAIVARRAGKDFPDYPLWARNWAGFGERAPEPMLGDVLIFDRVDEEGHHLGHVGEYVAEGTIERRGAQIKVYWVLSGNASNQVNIACAGRAAPAALRAPAVLQEGRAGKHPPRRR